MKTWDLTWLGLKDLKQLGSVPHSFLNWRSFLSWNITDKCEGAVHMKGKNGRPHRLLHKTPSDPLRYSPCMAARTNDQMAVFTGRQSPPKLWVVIWVGLSGHWQKQEINKTNWEERKGKCDWLRWGFRLSGCTQLITSSGSPNTLSSLPLSSRQPIPHTFCFTVFLPISKGPNKLLFLFCTSHSLAVRAAGSSISRFSLK